MPRTALAGLAAACVGAVALIAPSSAVAADDTRTEIPLPTFQVKEVCGPANDIVTIDPAWQAAWGDKVTIYAASLTFQNGGEYARPAGQILSPYRTGYKWVGTTGQAWTTWSLYPGTVTPVLDKNTACMASEPTFTTTRVRGPHNDRFVLTTESAAQWSVVDAWWRGQTYTVVLEPKDGFVTADGAATKTVVFTDSHILKR